MESQVAEEQVGHPLSKLAVQVDASVVATVSARWRTCHWCDGGHLRVLLQDR